MRWDFGVKVMAQHVSRCRIRSKPLVNCTPGRRDAKAQHVTANVHVERCVATDARQAWAAHLALTASVGASTRLPQRFKMRTTQREHNESALPPIPAVKADIRKRQQSVRRTDVGQSRFVVPTAS